MRAPLAMVVLMLAGAPATVAAQAPAGELIERTLAIVGGQAVTRSDVETARALGLAEGTADEATEALVERALVLREVQRYSPPEPTAAAVDERMRELTATAGGAREFSRVLAQGGFTEARLRAWVRDDLRIASYLSQRFAAVGTPAEEEVSAHFNAHRDEFERRGLSYADAAPEIRDRLSGERRDNLIEDWIADLRRRSTVVELWKSPRGR